LLDFRASFGALFLLDDFPAAEDISGGFGRGGAEDVRVAAHHFVVDLADDLGDGKAFFFVSDLGVKENLKKEIAEFFSELSIVSGVESVEDLVGFLDEIGPKGGVGLFAVPGASTGGAKTSHDGDEFFEVAADARRGVPFGRSLMRRTFCARFRRLATGFARWHGPIREKLRDDSLYGGRRDLTSESDEQLELWQAGAQCVALCKKFESRRDIPKWM
jgi:hypothetical protein